MGQTAAVVGGTGSERSPGATWSGLVGALFLIAAAFITLWVSPQLMGNPDAARLVEELYADSGSRSLLGLTEFLGVLGGVAFLWFAGSVREALAVHSERHSTTAFAGLLAFALLTMASFMASSTVAGTFWLTDAFVLDPHVAMLFGHLGYVLLMGAVGAAAVTLIAAGRLADGRSRIIRYVLAGLCVVPGVMFVYLPLVAFLMWCATVGLRPTAPSS